MNEVLEHCQAALAVLKKSRDFVSTAECMIIQISMLQGARQLGLPSKPNAPEESAARPTKSHSANIHIHCTALEDSTLRSRISRFLYRLQELEWAEYGKAFVMSAILTCQQELPSLRAEFQYQAVELMLTCHENVDKALRFKYPDEEEEMYIMLVASHCSAPSNQKSLQPGKECLYTKSPQTQKICSHSCPSSLCLPEICKHVSKICRI